ncbi:hypothetical protein [Epilithonimonas zeae]|uniref:hypothetical protein n=1 Tax=Epilithonimonas zeae TaxID=1416779 RepID=UPI00200C49E8|nr:hypothetical protein [Epilithonimonas zeae]UQB68884.1 hypothetical protein KI430_00100 [Epilithonimonas zeae]
MKKIILLPFILITVGISAQKTYPATVYLANGTSKTGSTAIINNTTSTIKLKSNSGQDSEKIKRDDITKINYYDEVVKDSVSFLHSDFIVDYKKSGKPIIKRSWMRKIYSGADVSAYVYETNYAGFRSATSVYTATSVQSYYLRHKNELPKFIFYTHNGFNYFNNKAYTKVINTLVKNFFDDLCPDVTKAYQNNEIILVSTPIPLVNYYEQKCVK